MLIQLQQKSRYGAFLEASPQKKKRQAKNIKIWQFVGLRNCPR